MNLIPFSATHPKFSLCVINKEGLCPSSGDINRLMMIPNEAYSLWDKLNTAHTFNRILKSLTLHVSVTKTNFENNKTRINL
jgi:hypothetical protein